jgi:hypothetical protein
MHKAFLMGDAAQVSVRGSVAEFELLCNQGCCHVLSLQLYLHNVRWKDFSRPEA